MHCKWAALEKWIATALFLNSGIVYVNKSCTVNIVSIGI